MADEGLAIALTASAITRMPCGFSSIRMACINSVARPPTIVTLGSPNPKPSCLGFRGEGVTGVSDHAPVHVTLQIGGLHAAGDIDSEEDGSVIVAPLHRRRAASDAGVRAGACATTPRDVCDFSV